MSFVIDSSVALTWCFDDEKTPISDALLLRLNRGTVYAPSLWPLEMLNVLLVAQRRGRINQDARRERIAFLRSLPVILDKETVVRAWATANLLAERHNLTLYDATYLELAQRLKLPLATLDKELRTAAKTLGVPLLGGTDD